MEVVGIVLVCHTAVRLRYLGKEDAGDCREVACCYRDKWSVNT
jgi:hypothetical protein